MKTKEKGTQYVIATPLARGTFSVMIRDILARQSPGSCLPPTISGFPES
jgi:hypothetical protein